MKTLILASALAFAASASYADGFATAIPFREAVVVPTTTAAPLSFVAYTEYAVEAQTYELGMNANYRVDAFTFGVGGAFAGQAGNFDFDRANLSVAYSFTDNAAVYTLVNFDDNLEYRDVVVGAVVRF